MSRLRIGSKADVLKYWIGLKSALEAKKVFKIIMEKQRKGILKRFKGQREIKCEDWKDLEKNKYLIRD